MKKKWPKEILEEAKKMRLTGSTYSEIGNKFQVAKSTMNSWFKGLPETSHQFYLDRDGWLKKIRALSSVAIRKKRNEQVKKIFEKAATEVNEWKFLNSVQEDKAILGILYLAEGSKLPERGASVRFTNTDPRLVLLFLTLLRRCYQIDESKLRVALHIHWYHDVKKTKYYWSKLLGVDESKFFKIYVKKRSETKRFRRNFAGICTIVYYSVDLRWEIVETGYNVAKKITGGIPTFGG